MYCRKCGQEVPDGVKYCGVCGYPTTDLVVREAEPIQTQQQPVNVVIQQPTNGGANYVVPASDKKKWVAFWMCLLGGWLGIHRFYVGKIFTGILYLLTLGLFGFGALIDLICILCGGFKDNAGMALRH